MESKYIVIGVVAVVVLFVIFYIKATIDEKKGENSEEKQKVKDIIKKVVPEPETYTAAYAIWEKIDIGGGGRTITTTTHYWYYAVGFKQGSLYVVPLSFDGGDMSYGEAMSFTKENVGMVNAKEGDSWMTLYDLEQKEMINFIVGPSNTKDDKYHPVNIQQKEEYQAFCDFVKDFMKEVNDYHEVTVTGKIGKPLKK